MFCPSCLRAWILWSYHAMITPRHVTTSGHERMEGVSLPSCLRVDGVIDQTICLETVCVVYQVALWKNIFSGNTSFESCTRGVKPEMQCNHHCDSKSQRISENWEPKREELIWSLAILAFLLGGGTLPIAYWLADGRGHQFVSLQIKVQSPSCILHLYLRLLQKLR